MRTQQTEGGTHTRVVVLRSASGSMDETSAAEADGCVSVSFSASDEAEEADEAASSVRKKV